MEFNSKIAQSFSFQMSSKCQRNRQCQKNRKQRIQLSNYPIQFNCSIKKQNKTLVIVKSCAFTELKQPLSNWCLPALLDNSNHFSQLGMMGVGNITFSANILAENYGRELLSNIFISDDMEGTDVKWIYSQLTCWLGIYKHCNPSLLEDAPLMKAVLIAYSFFWTEE